MSRRNARQILWGGAVCVTAVVASAQSAAANVSGAIWTSLSDGTIVNANNYAVKEDVYLNGGPGKGSGGNDPGLAPDGVYVFMVTDPSGKTLLSTDPAECREVQVINGTFAGATGPCPHIEGSAVVGIPVQLYPFSDSPNGGGEYKAWLTPLSAYVCPLDVPGCSDGTFGFINSESKTDNFKVGVEFQEIDAQFWSSAGDLLDGVRVRWIDTLGASNNKWSYDDPSENIIHRAHIEAVEAGTHYIVLENQPGCTIGSVVVDGELVRKFGAQTLPIKITPAMKKRGNFTVFVAVWCQ